MRNITARQETLLKELQTIDPELTIEWDEVRGVAAFVRGNLPSFSDDNPNVPKAASVPNLQSFLRVYGELFGPSNLTETLSILRNRTDDLGWAHLEFQQNYLPETDPTPQAKPLELYGSKLIAHYKPDGTLIEVQSSCWREIQLETEARINAKELREILTKAVENVPGFRELQRRMREQQEENFPIMQAPRLVIYPWKARFLPTWTTYAYGVVKPEEREGTQTGVQQIELGQVFVDASTGERFLFAPTRIGAETPDTGSGFGVTPLGGPFVSRSLNIVRVDGSSTYRLKDTTHARDIIAYDANANPSWTDRTNIPAPLNSGTIPASEDTDGDKNWNRLPANTTDAERTAGQQPEVDAFFFCREAYEWYNALAGSRAGWDDGQYSSPPVPPQPVRVLAHTYDSSAGTSRSINAFFDKGLVGGNWVSFLAFFDGDPTATEPYNYLAGSKFIVGHEYQHAITDFSFKDGSGNPGLTYSDWLAAVHEGLSDVFGGLFSEQWLPATDISPNGQIFRNLVYPRDDGPPPVTAAFDPNKFDHFGDRNTVTGSSARYRRGTIIAHCAYLMGQGGVHQRTSRTPALIPVYSLGRQTYNGKDILKAARIWYRSLTYYFGNLGTTTGIPANDETAFRRLRDGCVSAAQDIFGVGSPEHKNTILAFYAVGLHPTSSPYGADVTFLRWGADWWLSRPYVGISSPDWSSVDLFINNGGTSEWNALINVIGADGNPTQFENNVYCRVRNVGDQQAQNVQVQLFYAKAGTASTTWLPVTDKDGNIQVLSVGNLTAGQPNFPDSAQNSPPSTARVKWYIPPLLPGETVNHFCLKAVVTCLNDVNPHNNEVQSNIAYAPYAPGMGLHFTFMAGNPTDEELELDLRVQTALPKGWNVRLLEAQGVKLQPGKERPFQVVIDALPGADQKLEPPFDGELRGQVFGELTAEFLGTLTEVIFEGDRLQGRLAANFTEIGAVMGGLEGTLDVHTGQVKGRFSGIFQCSGKGGSRQVCLGIEACLRPLRRVNISQFVKGQPIGGLTIQVQVPTPTGACAWKLPPTDTQVNPEPVEDPSPEPTPEPDHAVTGKVTCLFYDCFGDFVGFALKTCSKEYHFHAKEAAIEKLISEACQRRWSIRIKSSAKDAALIQHLEVHC